MLSPYSVKALPFLYEEGKALINSNAVYDIYEDKEGKKWIGTLRGGVNMVLDNVNQEKSTLADGF